MIHAMHTPCSPYLTPMKKPRIIMTVVIKLFVRFMTGFPTALMVVWIIGLKDFNGITKHSNWNGMTTEFHFGPNSSGTPSGATLAIPKNIGKLGIAMYLHALRRFFRIRSMSSCIRENDVNEISLIIGNALFTGILARLKATL